MLAGNRQTFALTIEIPVEDFFSEARTPERVAAGKRSALSAPRVPKSPEDLRMAEEDCARRHCFHIEAVQARAARESQRAAEAKARRLRSEASARQRLESLFDAAAKRGALNLEEAKQKAEEKAELRRDRARGAKQARKAMQAARDEKQKLAFERVEDASRRAANVVQTTAAKSAFIAKRALAVVAAQKELQREAAAASSSNLTSKMEAAAERRAELLELAQPRVALRRVEIARAQLAQDEVDRLQKKVELERSMAAANSRRDEFLDSVVSKARADLSRVQATVEAREEIEAQAQAKTRCALFSKLNAADVRAKLALMRKATKKASRSVAFEVPHQPTTTLPASLVERLMTKSIKSRTVTSKGNKTALRHSTSDRVVRAKAARVAFAFKNSLLAHLAAASRAARASALKDRVLDRSRRGSALAQYHLQCRARLAHKMNKRVAAAAVRRSSAAAALRMVVARNKLRAVVAAGLRAERLLALNKQAVVGSRHAMAASKRSNIDAKRSSAALRQQLRCLLASLKASEMLVQKSITARMYSLPYQTMRRALRPAQQANPTKPEPAASAPMLLCRTPPMQRPTKRNPVFSPVGVESVPVEDSEPAVGGAICARSPVARRSKPAAVFPKPAVAFLAPAPAAEEKEEEHEELWSRIVAHNTAKRACKLAIDKMALQAADGQAGKRKPVEDDKPGECLFERVAKKTALEALKKKTAASAQGEEEWQLVDVM